MDHPVQLYDELLQLVKKGALLESTSAVLGWDKETCMPVNGAEHRASQLSLLSGIAHQAMTDSRIGELLDCLQDSELTDVPDADTTVNLREIRRRYERQKRLPQPLVEETAKVTALAQHHWAQARSDDDFDSFAPWLTHVVILKREEADVVGYVDGGEPYDALLDEYEPECTSRELTTIFGQLREKLVALLDSLLGAAHSPDVSILKRRFPVDRQQEFSRTAAAAIGFDFDSGRLDVAAHPFCSGFGPSDCRLTTRYDEHFFSGSFFGTLHEAGHGLYEQGLSAEAWGTPLGSSVSLGIHESQSRMWENIVGRSPAFWNHFYPQAQELFPESLAATPLDDFLFAVNAVSPSFIRVEADEVTYNLHIMLRFDLERELIAGRLDVRDVPSAWKDRFTDDFGITPTSDAEGCLQDVHWSAGLFGYFPTYTLGNMYAAHFFEAARNQLGDLDERFAAGKFADFREWLREQIHRHGQRFPAGRLVEVVTGDRLSDEPLMNHLAARLLPLYLKSS